MGLVKPTTVEELKELFFEFFINNNDNVTKISPLSTTNGIGYGIAKIGQKILKDLALVEVRLNPDDAYGQQLDVIANDRGVAPRFQASGSSTYIRVVGDPGTTYKSGVNTFIGNNGVVFDMLQDFTIGDEGFGYIKIRSVSQGESSNVNPLTITRVTPSVVGHKYCINEYKAIGGRDLESDDDFRIRIKENVNCLAHKTISMIEQTFNKINNNVLKCYLRGFNKSGKIVISILTQNGVDLSDSELNELLVKGGEYLSLVELRPSGGLNYGIELQNVEWFPIDISTRLVLESNVLPDDVRKEIQLRISKYFDLRTFDKTKIEWDDLLQIVKGTPGVKYVYDNYFSPGVDIFLPKNKLPRVRGFLMLNLDGSLIIGNSTTLNPIFYPSNPDFSYQQTVLANIR